MGYNTQYKLTQERNPVSAGTLAALITHDEEACYCLNKDGDSSESGKWYEHEKSLCAMSQIEPMVLFKLHGEGDEAGDVWDKYFVGGKKVHEVRISTDLPKPDFDSLVQDLKLTERQFVLHVPIVGTGHTETEAKRFILAALDAAEIEYDDTAIGDERPVPLR